MERFGWQGWGWITGGLLVFLGACGLGGDGGEVLVEVIGKPILARELEEFEHNLPGHLRSKKAGLEAHREHLQSLVDRQLMLAEAKKRELDRLPGLEEVLAEMMTQRLIERQVAALIEARIRIEEEELKAAYEQYNLGWQVWPAHILSATEEEAREVIRLLKEGADFSELARQRSLADDAEKGGNLGGFFDPGDAVPALREATFHLQPGEISEPIRTRDGYEVIKILEKRRLPYEQVRGTILLQMRQRKWVAQQAQVVSEFKERWKVRYHPERIPVALRALQGESLSEEEAMAPLISYEGGQLGVGAFVHAVKKHKKEKALADSLTLVRFAEQEILPDTLMVLAARAEGLDREPEMLAWKERKRAELLVSQLRIDEVVRKVEVSEAEVRQYYQEHLEDYAYLPGPIDLTEVIVETREQAEEILKAARAGERLEVLAAKYSLRPQMAPVRGHAYSDSGRLHIDTLIVSPYREFLGDVNREAVGQIQGPVLVQNRYSVFRLDKPVELVPLSYPQARRLIARRLRAQRESQLFTTFIDSLRAEYSGQVRWHEDRLRRFSERRAKVS